MHRTRSFVLALSLTTSGLAGGLAATAPAAAASPTFNVGSGADGNLSLNGNQHYLDTTTGTWTIDGVTQVIPGTLSGSKRIYNFVRFEVFGAFTVRGAYQLEIRATDSVSFLGGHLRANASSTVVGPLAAGPGPGGGTGGSGSNGSGAGSAGVGPTANQPGLGGGARDGATGYGAQPGCGGTGGITGGGNGDNGPTCSLTTGQGAGGGGGGGTGGTTPDFAAGGGGGGGGAVQVDAVTPTAGRGGDGGGVVRMIAGRLIQLPQSADLGGARGGSAPGNQIAAGGGGGAGGYLLAAAPTVVQRSGDTLSVLAGAGGYAQHVAAGDGGRGADGHVVIAGDVVTLAGDTSPEPTYLPFTHNTRPAVFSDQYDTGRDLTLTVPNPGVLDNDQDADNDVLTAHLVRAPFFGDLTLNAAGGFVYVPFPGYSGSDSFTYYASDASGDSETITVTITVRSVGWPEVTYGTAGTSTSPLGAPQAVSRGNVLQRDGKVVVVGSAIPSGADTDLWLTRLNADGSRDTTFGVGGHVYTDIAGFNDRATTAAILPLDSDPSHDRIVVVGSVQATSGNSDLAYAVYSLDGTLIGSVVRDTESIHGPGSTGGFEEATAVAVQAPDVLYVAGVAESSAIVRRFTVGAALGTDVWQLTGYASSSATAIARYTNAAAQETLVMAAVTVGLTDGVRGGVLARFGVASKALDTTFSGDGLAPLGPTWGTVGLDVVQGSSVPIRAMQQPAANPELWGIFRLTEPGGGVTSALVMPRDATFRALIPDPVSGGMLVFGTIGVHIIISARYTSGFTVDSTWGEGGRSILPVEVATLLPPMVLPDRRVVVATEYPATITALRLVGDSTKPAAVTALAAVVRDGGVQLSWSAPADTDLRDYRVCVGPAGLLHPYCKPVETTTATSAILTGLTNGESYSAGVRGVDTNGNVGLMIMTNFVPKVPTALQQSPVTTAKVTYGAALTFGATLRNAATAAPLAGEPVVLEGKRAGTASYVVLGTSLITDAAGIVTTSWKPLWGGDYRFRYAGTALGASVSAARAVTVASTLTSVLDVPQIPLGGGARISGALKPAHSKVTLDRLTAGVWKPVASTVPGSNGSYAFTVNPTVTGTYSYRVRFAGDTDHLAVTGPTRVLKVYELAILTVQPKTPEYVVVKNIGTVAVNLASWKVTSSTRSLLLPAYTLTAGSSLRVYVGKGTNVTGVRYLGSTTTAFNDVHDTIRVRDLTNRIAATRVY